MREVDIQHNVDAKCVKAVSGRDRITFSMRFFRSGSAPPRLFILGLDGSPLPLLRRLMRQGDLPNLARIFEEGAAVEMDSALPDVSAVAWTSINTGKNPGKHGIYGFVDRKPGTSTMEVMTAAHVRSKTIWELSSDQGRRSVALNVPLSYPPQRINGVVVSDFLAPNLAKAVYPTTALPYLETSGYRIDTDPWAARESLDSFLSDFRITAQKRLEAVLHFMQQEDWQLFMVVFMETDRLHHFMWQYMEEEHPDLGPKFLDAYRQIDGHVGGIVRALGKDDELIILSDHGFTSLKKEVYLNVWLEEQGYLKFLAGQERGLGTIDPSSTAYSLDPGRIYQNIPAGESGGAGRKDEGRGVIEELAGRLASLTDPDDGSPMTHAVYRKGEIYSGPEIDRAPDLLVMPNDGYDIKGTFEGTEFTGRGKLVGMHKYDNATLFIRNRKILVDHASVRDILPTACHLARLECPADVDGRIVASG